MPLLGGLAAELPDGRLRSDHPAIRCGGRGSTGTLLRVRDVGNHSGPRARRTQMRRFIALPLALVWIAGCGSDGGAGDAAVWEIDETAPPTAESTAFTALVTRLGCASGETGNVQEPQIALEPDRVVVTFSVESLSGGDESCPGNKFVPYEVEVDEPIGDRTLIDGACLAEEAESTSFCSGGSERWSP